MQKFRIEIYDITNISAINTKAIKLFEGIIKDKVLTSYDSKMTILTEVELENALNVAIEIIKEN